MSLFTSYIQFLWCLTKISVVSSPTRISSSLNITTEGVIFSPTEFGIISTPPFLYTPIQENVVPKSKPIA